MNRMMSLALFIIGIVLLVYGFNAADSISSDVSRVVSGAPTNKSLWLLISGTVILVLGAGSYWQGSQRR